MNDQTHGFFDGCLLFLMVWILYFALWYNIHWLVVICYIYFLIIIFRFLIKGWFRRHK